MKHKSPIGMCERGMYLAQGCLLTPALAALVTRLFFYEKKFKDAKLCFGRPYRILAQSR